MAKQVVLCAVHPVLDYGYFAVGAAPRRVGYETIPQYVACCPVSVRVRGEAGFADIREAPEQAGPTARNLWAQAAERVLTESAAIGAAAIARQYDMAMVADAIYQKVLRVGLCGNTSDRLPIVAGCEEP